MGAFLVPATILLPGLSEGSPQGQDELPRRQVAPEARAFQALGDLGLREKPPTRERIVRQLIQGLEAEEARLEKEDRGADPDSLTESAASRLLYEIRTAGLTALVKVGRVAEEALPLYAEALKSGSGTVRAGAALVIAGRGLEAKDLLGRVFKEAPIEHVVSFYETVLPPPWGSPIFTGDEHPDPQEARQIARVFAKDHGEPRVRAVSLSFAIVLGRAGNDFQLDLDLLKDVFSSDSELLVKRAAVRMAGFLGGRPGHLDLKSIILREKDLLLLRDAIEARGLWSTRDFGQEAFELCDGVLCDWLPGKERNVPDWSDEEVVRMEDLLLEEKDTQFRDTASMALAERHRGGGRYRPRKVPALKVHEWGVWRDQGGTLAPPDEELAELPRFVHRSLVSAEELWDERSYMPMAVQKPVVFFYAPEPLSLLVQVRYFQGRPWTFFPQATDYQETSKIAGRLRRNASEEEQKIQPFMDRKGITPEWIKPSGPAKPKDRMRFPDFRGPRPEGLRAFYRGAPWVHPGHPRQPTLTGPGPVIFTGMGIEWCGLRVGYESNLEPGPPPVEPGHWWSALREVPSSPVAVRGESERFLFYDGAVNLPSPVSMAWEADSREVLLLSTGKFGAYPEASESQRELWGENTRSDTRRESERYPDSAPLPAVWVISKVPGAEARGGLIENLESQTSGIRVPLDSLHLEGEALRRRFGEVLEKQGLTAEETRALLRTWEKEFFQTEGTRALTVIPRWLYDAMLPLEIDPGPGELVRVGIIWSEGLAEAKDKVDETSRHAHRWTPGPVKIERTKVEIREAQLDLEPGLPFAVEGDGMISGFPFRFEARRLTWNGRGILLRELSKEPTGLYLADLQDRLATRVATLPGYWDRVHVESFVSGDSQRIFFTSPKEEPSTLMIADRGQKKILRAPVSDRSCSEFETSGDGNRVAWVEPAGFDAGDRAVVLDLQAGELLQVQFEQPQTRPWAEGCGGRLSISPDGHRLACVVRSANGDGEILLLDLDTGTVLNVSGSLAEDRNPCLAQGGRLVLFSSDRDRGNSLYLADAEAGTLAKVVKQTGGGCAPWITEDGSQVFFALEGALWRKDLKSGQEAKVIGSETENVYGASISADGKRALVNWIERETRRSRITLHELSSQ